MTTQTEAGATRRTGAPAPWPRRWGPIAVDGPAGLAGQRAEAAPVRTFKVSNDPHFAEKLVDVVGLYLDPPEHALVLCVDEKSQIQALDRTQKSLPIYPGRLRDDDPRLQAERHDHAVRRARRAEGRVIGQCMPRHRHQEWIKFLKQIDAETPPEVDLHLIVDNYATHKHPKVQGDGWSGIRGSTCTSSRRAVRG